MAKVGKHLNYRVTTPAFSAQQAWQRGTGGESWNVQYGDSTISHKSEVLPEAQAEGPQSKRRGRELMETNKIVINLCTLKRSVR
jgi:hypothetical protein